MSDEVAVGSHLVSQRHFHGALPYTHHGIYIGNGQVVHYAGLSDDPDADGTKIQVVTLEGFHGGNGYWLVPHPLAPFAGEKVVERARSRLGEDGYSVCANNCEHFCNWAIDGNHASQQVDVGALASAAGGGGIGGIVGGLVIPAVAATATNLAGGAAMMKGLAVIGTFTGGAVGGLATAGGALGLAVAPFSPTKKAIPAKKRMPVELAGLQQWREQEVWRLGRLQPSAQRVFQAYRLRVLRAE
jgi:hypothetical protein